LTIDLNRANISSTDFCTGINALLDKAALEEQREARRDYLGASGIGSECLRKVQYDWQVDSTHPARTKRIFARGHLFEDITVKALNQAGFRIERDTEATRFAAVDGDFRGHADGIMRDGPAILQYPCLFEHKALGDSGWKKLEKDGLRKAYPQYFDQCQLYMAYLDLTDNPCLFTAINSNTCEILHIEVPFDAEAAQAASDRAVLIIKATRSGEILDRIAKSPTDWRCKMCNHKERCWA
jgi:hypothetical protein